MWESTKHWFMINTRHDNSHDSQYHFFKNEQYFSVLIFLIANQSSSTKFKLTFLCFISPWEKIGIVVFGTWFFIEITFFFLTNIFYTGIFESDTPRFIFIWLWHTLLFPWPLDVIVYYTKNGWENISSVRVG